ncbi:MAG: hypothetical protein IJV07_04135 [Alphaproteobacteria bacterium]|nr:hypothetical protein [Alphaproteobacteria bacterium]
MAYLENYIERGKELTGSKSACLMGIIGVIIGGLVGFFFHTLIRQDTIQTVIREVPIIEIGQEQVQTPLRTIWERKIPNTDIVIKLDTNQDSLTPDSASGLFLGRRFLTIALRGQVMRYTLPMESVKIDQAVIQKILKQMTIQIGIMIGGMAFIFLFVGYWGTVGLSIFIFRLLKKDKDEQQIRRSAWIGWWAVIGLDIIFLLCRTSFSWVGSLFLATIIAIFCLLQLEDTH